MSPLSRCSGFLLLFSLLLAGCGEETAGPQAAPQPLDDSPGAKVMRKYCSSCHAPPKTTTHPAEEWPNVVYRMSERLRLRGYHPMSGEETELLVSYLQEHAKK